MMSFSRKAVWLAGLLCVGAAVLMGMWYATQKSPTTPAVENPISRVLEQLTKASPLPQDEFSAFLEAATQNSSETSYTKKYQVFAGITGQSIHELLTQEAVAAFVEQERHTLLPPQSDATLEGVTTEEVTAYQKSISPISNPSLTNVSSTDIAEAFRRHWQNPKGDHMKNIIASLKQNSQVLQDITPATSLVMWHAQYVALSESLAVNVRLLEAMPVNPIGGLIASRNIEDLGAQFNALASALASLVP